MKKKFVFGASSVVLNSFATAGMVSAMATMEAMIRIQQSLGIRLLKWSSELRISQSLLWWNCYRRQLRYADLCERCNDS